MSIDRLLFGNSSYQTMRAALDASALRQKVIADNVANAETPGFRPHEVAFEELLTEVQTGGTQGPSLALAPSGGRGSSGLASVPGSLAPPISVGSALPRPQVIESAVTDPETGAATAEFDMERAMGDLNANRVLYATLTQLLSNRLIGLKNAIESR